MSLLYKAISTKNLLLLQKIISEQKININQHTETHSIYFRRPLQLAVEHNNLEAVLLLLNNNADINIQDYDNWTALHLACRFGNYQMIKILLDYNANINIKTVYGNTCFNIAEMYGKHHIKKYIQLYLLFKIKREELWTLWELE